MTIDAAPDTLRTDDFDFDLPPELIAQHPASPRDSARLLEVGETLRDRAVTDLPDILKPGDLLVVNDTRVLPSRLDGRLGGRPDGRGGDARIEVTLHKEDAPGRWRAFAKPGRKLRVGDEIVFAEDFSATVRDKPPGGDIVLDFAGGDVAARLKQYGRMPLPPYIRRTPSDRSPSDQADGGRADTHDYQTIYAERDGAVAAPTAGLHFTDALLARLAERGVGMARLTLHVGAGTFLPVRADYVRDHRMHAEYGVITEQVAAAINAARAAGGRIVSVGTTSLRLLESAADDAGRVHPFAGETSIFITPGYRFKAVDLLLTNFHLPRSTLFMLVAAFAGLDRMKRAYAHAVAERYRFFSYGDTTLLYPGDSR